MAGRSAAQRAADKAADRAMAQRLAGALDAAMRPQAGYASQEVANAAVVAELRSLGLDSGTARVIAARSAAVAPPGATPLTPAMRAAHGQAAASRAAYLVGAGRRLAGTSGLARLDQQTKERRFLNQHVAAQNQREQGAMALDAASNAYGPLLGWKAVLDDRTTPECRAADGKNFRPARPPAIGLPGVTHTNCRCRPTTPFEGAPTLGPEPAAVAADASPPEEGVAMARNGTAIELAGTKPKDGPGGTKLYGDGQTYDPKTQSFHPTTDSEKNFNAKHPRAAKGASGGSGGQFVKAGQARNSGAAVQAQANPKAKGNYERIGKLTDPKAQATEIHKLNSADLTALSQYAYSFKSTDPKLVALRVRIAGELRSRGLDVNKVGGGQGGAPVKPKAPAKAPVKLSRAEATAILLSRQRKRAIELAADTKAAPEPKHKGGMVALLPTAAHAKAMAVPGGESPEDMHVTLTYLGDDVTGWSPEQHERVINRAKDVAQHTAPFEGRVFGHATFNPDAYAGHEPCAVHLVGGTDRLHSMHRELKGLASAAQHPGFTPHVTGAYGKTAADLKYTGPVKFDRMLVALGDKRTEIPLKAPTRGNDMGTLDFSRPELGELAIGMAAALSMRREAQAIELGKWSEVLHPRAPGGGPIGGQFVSAKGALHAATGRSKATGKAHYVEKIGPKAYRATEVKPAGPHVRVEGSGKTVAVHTGGRENPVSGADALKAADGYYVAPAPSMPQDRFFEDAKAQARGRIQTARSGGRALELSAKTAGYSTTHSPLGRPGGPGLWGHKGWQLPAYIQNVAKGIERSGKTRSKAIELAVGKVRDWAEGKGKVGPEVKAASAKAIAEWEALRARTHAGKVAIKTARAGDRAIELAFSEKLHPRLPKGLGGGRFTRRGGSGKVGALRRDERKVAAKTHLIGGRPTVDNPQVRQENRVLSSTFNPGSGHNVRGKGIDATLPAGYRGTAAKVPRKDAAVRRLAPMEAPSPEEFKAKMRSALDAQGSALGPGTVVETRKPVRGSRLGTSIAAGALILGALGGNVGSATGEGSSLGVDSPNDPGTSIEEQSTFLGRKSKRLADLDIGRGFAAQAAAGQPYTVY